MHQGCRALQGADRFLWTASAFLAAACVALGWTLALRAASLKRGGPEHLEEPAWDWHWPEAGSFRDLPDRFDLALNVALSELPDSAVRVAVLAEKDEGPAPIRGAFVDCSARGVSFGRIEGGLALARAFRPLELGTGSPHVVVIKRRGASLVVTVDGGVALLGMEPHFRGGGVALALAGGARCELAPVTRLPDFPEFADDFMRTPKEPSPWTVRSGSWQTSELPTPSMSANAFSFRGSGEQGRPAFAFAGDQTWDEYRVEVSARGEPGGAVGLAFGVRGESYALFRWSSRGPEGGGRRELVLVESEGRETVLASAPGGYSSGQWYRLAVELGFGRACAFVDGLEVLAARHPSFASGAIGLWSSGERGASFDDVLVLPRSSVEEDFGLSPPDLFARWEAVGGFWRPEDGAMVGRARGERAAGAKLLTGAPWWRRVAAEAELRSPGAGIIVNYRDESDYALLRADERSVSLERVRGSRRQVLDQTELPPELAGKLGRGLALRLETDRGYLCGYVGGKRLVEGWDEGSLEGRAGLWVPGGGEGAWRSFRAEFIPHRPPVGVVNPVFESDNIMAGWAGEGSDWYRSDESAPGRDVMWHLAPFHGDAELALDLPELEGRRGRVVLGVAKSADKPRNGYGWALEPAPAEAGRGEREDRPPASAASDGWVLSLQREGETVGEASVGSGEELDSIFLRRQGRYVVAGANAAVLACFRDPAPLAGARIAYLAEGLQVHPSRARVYGGHVYDYRFNEAPADWRVAAGLWEVTNRWKCDPRWSFFSGRPDPDSSEKAAVIWNKRRFQGDLVIDFYVGPKMEPEKGKRYEYARDFNVTIAADGADLTSGYSFLFGGFGNTRSCILRGTKVLAEETDPAKRIPASMIIHQRWYHMRVERTGGRLRFRVIFERTPVLSLECEDPDPLRGDRVAIWTYDCGIMVARLRMAAASCEGVEGPDFRPPARVRTPYDAPPPEGPASRQEGPGT